MAIQRYTLIGKEKQGGKLLWLSKRPAVVLLIFPLYLFIFLSCSFASLFLYINEEIFISKWP